MKKCSKCNKLKELHLFYRRAINKDGFTGVCKECMVNRGKLYHQNNRVECLNKQQEYRFNNKEKINRLSKEYRKNNKDKIDQYRKDNREKTREYGRIYYQNNKSKKAQYKKSRSDVDINFKLANNLRSRLNQAIKGNYKAGSAVSDLGCSIEELKVHLESQFFPGMTWANWSRTGWHIDHIKALANFNLTNEVKFKKAVHHTNLQPLWAKDNMSYGAKRKGKLFNE